MKSMLAILTMLTVAGCATVSGEKVQPISLQTIQDNIEISGVGCTLMNDSGKWFVTSPGSVTVHKSTGNLAIDCSKDGNLVGHETLVSKSNGAVWGNIIAGGGIGYIVDRNTGAGFNYPNNIAVVLHKIENAVGLTTPTKRVKLDNTKSQNIEFLFYFPTKEAATRIATSLNLHGFVTKVQPAENGNNFSVVAQKIIIPTESTLAGLRLLFNDMAITEHGEFDSWQLAATQ